MKKIISFSGLLFFLHLLNISYAQRPLMLSLLEPVGPPVIGKGHPGSAGNKNGYEGGTVFRHKGKLHLFVTEEITGWVGTRTGHWASKNGLDWTRVGTVQESVKDENDARHSIWSPMPVYNDNDQRWNLFYVGYESAGTIHGRVFRAISQKRGRAGIDGPYKDVDGAVMSYADPVKNEWEGLQGTDSFYPFEVNGKWMSFYGSSDARSYWDVGLAVADSLEGKWKRIISPPVFSKSENPIVTKLDDGTLLAVYDDLTVLSANDRIAYAWSVDGLQWQKNTVQIPLTSSYSNIRTPQGLVTEGKDTFWLYFTANTKEGFDVVGRSKIRVNRPQILPPQVNK